MGVDENGIKKETPEKEKVGFIGLGAMGQPMSRRLLEAGYKVVAYDLRPEAVTAAVSKGGGACFFGRRGCREMPEGYYHRSQFGSRGPGDLRTSGPPEGLKTGDILMEMTSAYPSTIRVHQALTLPAHSRRRPRGSGPPVDPWAASPTGEQETGARRRRTRPPDRRRLRVPVGGGAAPPRSPPPSAAATVMIPAAEELRCRCAIG